LLVCGNGIGRTSFQSLYLCDGDGDIIRGEVGRNLLRHYPGHLSLPGRRGWDIYEEPWVQCTGADCLCKARPRPIKLCRGRHCRTDSGLRRQGLESILPNRAHACHCQTLAIRLLSHPVVRHGASAVSLASPSHHQRALRPPYVDMSTTSNQEAYDEIAEAGRSSRDIHHSFP